MSFSEACKARGGFKLSLAVKAKAMTCQSCPDTKLSFKTRFTVFSEACGGPLVSGDLRHPSAALRAGYKSCPRKKQVIRDLFHARRVGNAGGGLERNSL
jgi:hypothetical protein